MHNDHDNKSLDYASPDTDEERPDPPMQQFGDNVGFVPSIRGRDSVD